MVVHVYSCSCNGHGITHNKLIVKSYNEIWSNMKVSVFFVILPCNFASSCHN